MTAVLRPASARPDEKLALVVVLPTPPLPEVTTTMRVIGGTSFASVSGSEAALARPESGAERREHERAAVEAHLRRPPQHFGRQRRVDRAVRTGDGHELRL